MYSIRSGAIEGYEKLVYQLGYNPHEILNKMGMSHAQLREPEARIPYLKIADLLDLTAQTCKDPVFALRLAETQTAMAIGELVLSTSQQSTLRESFQFSSQHLRLHAQGIHLKLRINDDKAEVHLHFDFTNSSGLQQLIFLSVGQIYNVLITLLGETNPLIKINFQQTVHNRAKASVTEYGAYLETSALFNGVHFPVTWLDRVMSNNNQLLKDHLNKRIQLLESIYPEDLPSQVRYMCSNLLPSGECNIERVSAALSLHPRVLQKKLLAENTSFSQLLQLTRTVTAQQQLLHSNSSILEIALNLGYSEASVFCRNFKKWTGLSPMKWRTKNKEAF